MAGTYAHTTFSSQAVRNWGLVRLELSGLVEPSEVAPFLTPSLTTLIAEVAFPPTPEAALLPTPLLLITSLDIDMLVDLLQDSGADVSRTLAVLAQQLPQLTSLHLRGGGPMTQLQDAHPLPAMTALSLLTRLRHLLVGGPSLAQCLAPAISTLPDLTSLGLPGGVRPEGVRWLPPLTRLRSLTLGRRWQDKDTTEADIGAHLEAVRQMRGLTELVLHLTRKPSTVPPLFGPMVPPPAMLRRLVVSGRWMLEEAERAWGRYVDEICLVASESFDSAA
jgi:hypothetical protein